MAERSCVEGRPCVDRRERCGCTRRRTASGASAAVGVNRKYDKPVDYYHLIYANWDSAILPQSECLSEALSASLGNAKMSIHDMTCGVGTTRLVS